MSMAISGGVAHGKAAHQRPANFGQLNSAIARGDLDGAQAAFNAISDANTPSAQAVKARGSLDALGEAISGGDLETVRAALADFRAGRVALAPTPPPTAPAGTDGVIVEISAAASLLDQTSDTIAEEPAQDSIALPVAETATQDVMPDEAVSTTEQVLTLLAASASSAGTEVQQAVEAPPPAVETASDSSPDASEISALLASAGSTVEISA